MTATRGLVGPSVFCRNFRFLLCDRGFTCVTFAARMPHTWAQSKGAGARKVQRYLHGRQDPKLATVELFARALRVEPGVLAWSPDVGCDPDERHATVRGWWDKVAGVTG